MMKFVVAAAFLATGTIAGAYSQPPEHNVASTSCTQNSGIYTAPPQHVVEPAPSYTASAVHGAGTPAIHKVIVGGDAGLVYTPEFIYAAVGDVVEFHFLKQNHSITQSTFAKPCVRKPDGIDSGLLPNPNNTVTPAPIFQYTVDTTEATCKYFFSNPKV